MRSVIAWTAFGAGAAFVITDIVRLNITGLFLLGVVLLTVWLWGVGAFTRVFWFGTPLQEAECCMVDHELEAEGK